MRIDAKTYNLLCGHRLDGQKGFPGSERTTPYLDGTVVATVHAVIHRRAFGELSILLIIPSPSSVVRNGNSCASVVESTHYTATPAATILCYVACCALTWLPKGPPGLPSLSNCDGPPTVVVSALSSADWIRCQCKVCEQACRKILQD